MYTHCSHADSKEQPTNYILNVISDTVLKPPFFECWSHWLNTRTLIGCKRLLCRYRKRTDIYYSTWSFENVAKNCQFQFLAPPKYCCQFQNCQFQFLDPPPKLPVSVFRPPTKYCCQFQFLDPPPNNQFQFLDPLKILLPVSVFRPPTQNCQFQFLDPPPKYCCQFQNCQFQFLDPPQNCQFQFLDPPQNIVASFRIASFGF